MFPSTSTFSRIVFALLLFVASTLYAQPSERLRLQRYTTQHYTIHTNLGRNDAAVFGRHMDAVFAEARQQFKIFGDAEQERMDLYLFRKKEEYEAFLSDHGMNGANTGGMFFVQRDIQGLAAWTQGKPRSQVFAVLQHEGFHQFVWDYIGPQVPIWANEGLAQLFEDSVLVRKRLIIGLRNSLRVARVKDALQNDQTLDFDVMLRMSMEEWRQTILANPQRSVLLYDQVWSMAYFLAMEESHRGKFTRYLELLKSNRNAGEAFTEAFGKDIVKLGEQWRDFALNVEPDALNLTVSRLEFFGQGLLLLNQRKQKMPRDFAALRSQLQRIDFRLDVTSQGSVMRFTARDEENFRVELPRGTKGRFVLLPPTRNDLLPRITAEGLNPIPTLVWSKNEDGELVQDIEYR